ncbi:MAG: hypothetical protein VCG02_16660 [Verrucomicrobiota bacterium]
MRRKRLNAKGVFMQFAGYVVLTVLTLFLLKAQLGSVNQEFRVRATMQVLYEGMQAYYHDKESYVEMSTAPAAALVQILMVSGHLEQAPLNPYTSMAYAASDAEHDKIRYEAAPDFKSFTLKAERPDSSEIWVEMESPSLSPHE